MKIAIIGAGSVGRALGTSLQAKGYEIVYGVRDSQKTHDRNARPVAQALSGAKVVILALPWTASEALVCEHALSLAGKIVIDATNPLTANQTRLAVGFVTSGVELLQSQARSAKFYKAFNTTGVSVMAKPQFAEGKAAMLVAGPDGPDKQTVLRIVADVGFDAVDAGELKAARLLEPLAMLWMQLSLTRGRDFAFVMARRQSNKTHTARPVLTPVPQEAE